MNDSTRGTRSSSCGPSRPTRGNPRSSRLRGRLTRLALAVVAGLVGVLLATPAAYAEGEVEVSIDGLSDSLRAGGSDDFRVTFTNESGESIGGIIAVVAVALPDAPADGIFVQRNGGGDLPRQVADDGTVIFTDTNPFDLGRGGGNARRRIDFTIFFGDAIPSGEAVITVAAQAGGELLGSASTTLEIRGAVTTPPNTNPGVQPTFEAGPTYSLAPIPEAAAPPPPTSTVPTTVYVLGTMLAATGLITLVLTFWAPGRRWAGEYSGARTGWTGWTGRARPDQRELTVRPAGPAAPRPARPADSAPLRSEGPQQWPVVARASVPARPSGYSGPITGGAVPPVRDPGPATGTGRAIRDPGPATGTGRAIRDPDPSAGSRHRARDAAPDDPWRYD